MTSSSLMCAYFSSYGWIREIDCSRLTTCMLSRSMTFSLFIFTLLLTLGSPYSNVLIHFWCSLSVICLFPIEDYCEADSKERDADADESLAELIDRTEMASSFRSLWTLFSNGNLSNDYWVKPPYNGSSILCLFGNLKSANNCGFSPPKKTLFDLFSKLMLSWADYMIDWVVTLLGASPARHAVFEEMRERNSSWMFTRLPFLFA